MSPSPDSAGSQIAAPGSAHTAPPANTASVDAKPARLVSLDAYRGFIMAMLASEGLGIAATARKLHDSPPWHIFGYDFYPWRTLQYNFEHVKWLGCGFWDLIQPSFMFMVGAAAAYSWASRAARGDSYGKLLRHTLVRSVVLVLLGVFLRTRGGKQTNFTFMDVVSQIGLGYTFLFLLWNRPRWVQGAAAALILFGYWLLFALYPLPAENFNYNSVGVRSGWKHLEGFQQHWDKGTNPAAKVDVWFLNLFPRAEPFAFDGSGYPTLNFIPATVTMLFGLLAGELLRGPRSRRAKFWLLVGSGAAAMAAGKVLDLTGICPIVKIIWTPSWTLFSTGWVLWMLASFYLVIDIAGWRRWAFPLVIVGMNSLLMYVMYSLLRRWFSDRLRIHFGQDLFDNVARWLHLGDAYVPIVESVLVLATMWLVCFWLYRQRIFVRI